MTARTFVACSVGLMTLGRVADTLVTYHFSPGLELEANPLASVLGLGWFPLLAMNVIVVAGIAFCSVRWCTRPLKYERSAEVHDLWTFASFACYGRVYPPLTFLRRRLLMPPTTRAHTLHLIGAVMPVTVAVMSAVAVFSWDALYGWHSESYSYLYKLLWPFFPYGVVIPTVWFAALYFYQHEFRRYQQLCAVEIAHDKSGLSPLPEMHLANNPAMTMIDTTQIEDDGATHCALDCRGEEATAASSLACSPALALGSM